MFILRDEYFDSKRHKPIVNLPCPAQDFVQEWQACAIDITRSTDTLFSYLQGPTQHWLDMLRGHIKPDINLASLLFKINHPDPWQVMQDWVAIHGDTLRQLILCEWLGLLRFPPFTLRKQGGQFCFVLARLLVFRLSNNINSWLASRMRQSRLQYTADMDIYEAPIEEQDVDDLMLDLHETDPYAYYLFSLFLNDHTRNDINSITRTTTSYVYLWRLINAEFNKRRSD